MKNKYLLTTIILLFSIFCYAQQKTENKINNEGKYWQSLLLPALIAVGGYILKSIYEVLLDKEKRRRNLLEDKLKNFYWPILTRLEENDAIWRLILSKRYNQSLFGNASAFVMDDAGFESSLPPPSSTTPSFTTAEEATENSKIINRDEMEKKIAFYVEENILLRNHREIMKIIMTNRYLAKFDDALSKCLQKYFKHVAIYEGILICEQNIFPSTLGAAYPKEFDEIIEKRTIELQKQLDKKTLL